MLLATAAASGVDKTQLSLAFSFTPDCKYICRTSKVCVYETPLRPNETQAPLAHKNTSKHTCFQEHVHHLAVATSSRPHKGGDAVAAAVVRGRPALEQLLEHVSSALAGGEPEGGHSGLGFGVNLCSRLEEPTPTIKKGGGGGRGGEGMNITVGACVCLRRRTYSVRHGGVAPSLYGWYCVAFHQQGTDNMKLLLVEDHTSRRARIDTYNGFFQMN